MDSELCKQVLREACRSREMGYLVLSKIGILAFAFTWFAPQLLGDGTVTGVWFAVFVAGLLVSAGCWGFAYGVLYEMAD
jgi:hypothetical protein